MNITQVRQYALSLPEVTEEPHHHFSSFRVRGKIFVTVPPNLPVIHVFVSEQKRETALALHPDFLEKLLWGGKVVGLRIALAQARPAVVRQLVADAWRLKAPPVKTTRGAARPTKQQAFDWHCDTITRATLVDGDYRNTQNVRRFLVGECGAAFKFDRGFMQWIKNGEQKTMGDVAREWERRRDAG